MITYMTAPRASTYLSCVGGERALEHLDRVPRGRDGVQALFAVPDRACRVHHAYEHLRHTEPPLSDLGDDDVRVVAVRRGDEHVCALDAGLDERVALQG